MNQRRSIGRQLKWIVPCGVLAVACAGGPDELAYIERLGDDTLAVEVFTRTAQGIEGQLLTRNPVTRVATYTATLSPEGRITRLEVDWTVPAENPEGPEPQHYVVTLEGDSAVVESRTAEGTDTTRVAVPAGTVPGLGKVPVAVAIWSQAVHQAVAGGQDTTAITLLPAVRPRPQPNAIVRRSDDTVSLSFFGSPMYARVDRDGRILGITGRETTFKFETERVRAVDFDALAADFAARDARGEGLGVPSPRAEVEAAVAGANFTVVYSRPAKRGREIWGALVPHNEIWRTGANAATMFTTDRDLVIGGSRVPAGSYTLFTTFTVDTDTLIINKETGQSGAQYDPLQDLVRIPLERGVLDEPVERFTIAVEARGGNAVLKLVWDTRELWVVIEVAGT